LLFPISSSCNDQEDEQSYSPGYRDMSKATAIVLIFFLSITQSALADDTDVLTDNKLLKIGFVDSEKYDVTADELRLITDIITRSEQKVRGLLPTLPEKIDVIVTFVDEDFNHWGMPMGLNGRAEAPGVAIFDISTRFPGGIDAAVKKNLSLLVFHEFHHLARGWTINDNKFGQGIPIAVVNEGLAVVFSEQYADGTFEKLANPENGNLWLTEILALPIDADYGQWMNQHSDGRFSIGYRTGKFVVNKAIANTGISVLDLSKYSPVEILVMAAEEDI
jgi:hypothetical protein